MSAVLSASLAVLLFVAAGIAAVAWWSFARSRKSRIALLAAGFTIMAGAAAASAYILERQQTAETALAVQSLLIAGALLLIYWAAAKR